MFPLSLIARRYVQDGVLNSSFGSTHPLRVSSASHHSPQNQLCLPVFQMTTDRLLTKEKKKEEEENPCEFELRKCRFAFGVVPKSGSDAERHGSC